MPRKKGSKNVEKEPPVKAGGEKGKRKRRHKPKDFPKRPLSAYNIFFKETRENIIKESKEGDNVDFQTMAKEIAARWKALESPERERVDKLASEDMERYREAVKNYEDEMVKRSRKEREEQQAAEEEAAAKKKAEEEEAAALAAEQEAKRREQEEEMMKQARAARAVAGGFAASNGVAAALSARRGVVGGMDHSLLAAHEAEAAAVSAGAGGNELEREMLLREQLAAMQQREAMQRQLLLMEELRAVEAARAAQARQLGVAGLPPAGGEDYLSTSLQAAQMGSHPTLGHESLLNKYGGLGAAGLPAGAGLGLGAGAGLGLFGLGMGAAGLGMGGLGAGGWLGLGAGAGLFGQHSDPFLALLAAQQGAGLPGGGLSGFPGAAAGYADLNPSAAAGLPSSYAQEAMLRDYASRLHGQEPPSSQGGP